MSLVSDYDMSVLFVLKNKIAIACNDSLEWAKFMATPARVVDRTEIDGIVVSTIFLGVDYNFIGVGDPLLFETLVFMPDKNTGQMDRYFTWGEAEEGHQVMVKIIREQLAHVDMLTIDTLAALMVVARNTN